MTRKAELALVLSAGLISQQDADRIQRSALALKIQDIQEEKAAEQKRQVDNICRLNPRERRKHYAQAQRQKELKRAAQVRRHQEARIDHSGDTTEARVDS